MSDRPTDPAAAAALADLLRRRQDVILDEWRSALRPAGAAAQLDEPSLFDSLPGLLTELAAVVARGAPLDDPDAPVSAAVEHALDRLGEGFDLAQVVREYSVLRDVVLRVWARQEAAPVLTTVRALTRALDGAIRVSVQLFTDQRNRTLVALDRISSAALEARTLHALLRALLAAVVDSCRAADTAAILLLRAGELRVEATVGLEAAVEACFAVRVGEGFAGTIAAERRPRELSEAWRDPLVQNPHLRARGVRALYGVPLLAGGELVGVAHMGSLRAAHFSATDRQLFGAMAERAAAGIRLHALRDEGQRRAAELHDRAVQQATLAELGARALAGDDGAALLAEVAERVADVLGADLSMVGELEGDRLHLRAGAGWGEGVVGRASLPLFPDSLAGLALHQHAPAVVEDARATPEVRLAPLVLAHGGVAGASVPLEHGAQHGVLSVFMRRPHRFRAFDVQFLQAAGSLLAVAMERGRALAESRAREAEARCAADRLRFLSDAGTVLAGSLDVQRTAQALTDLAVPTLADWSMLDLAGEDGLVRAVAISSADPDPQRLDRIRAFRETHPIRRDSPYGLATVLVTGRPILMPLVDEAALRPIAPDAQYVRWMLDAGIRSLLAVPLRGPSGAFGVLSFATALSGRTLGEEDRTLAQDLAARAGLALENARLYEEAQRAVRLREDVLAVVSHDLKTPLHAIRLTAQLLARKVASDPAAAKNAANIDRAAERMGALLRDLLDMASIRAGRLPVRLAPTPADDVARDALELYAALAQERGVALAREGGAGRVLADRDRLLQVLGNLLANAIRFSPQGGTVTLRLAPTPGGVRFEVRDQGPGIAPADVPRLFEAWWSRRGPGAAGGSSEERGTGLGLFIARGIVAAHGARLEVDSAPGHGAAFGFELAAAPGA